MAPPEDPPVEFTPPTCSCCEQTVGNKSYRTYVTDEEGKSNLFVCMDCEYPLWEMIINLYKNQTPP